MTNAQKTWADFTGLAVSHQAVQHLAMIGTPQAFDAGAALIKQGDKVECFTLIAQGRCTALRYTKSGQEVWLSDLQPGDVLGDLAMFKRVPAAVSVIAQTPTKVFNIGLSQFEEAMRQYGDLSFSVASNLSYRLRGSIGLIANLTTLPAHARVLVALERMADNEPSDGEPAKVSNPPSVSNLAARIYATRETTSRALSRLKRNGQLKDLDGTWIVMPASQKLD